MLIKCKSDAFIETIRSIFSDMLAFKLEVSVKAVRTLLWNQNCLLSTKTADRKPQESKS